MSTLAMNEHLGHAVRQGSTYLVTFQTIGCTFRFEADATQGPDLPLPQNADVIVRSSPADWMPTLVFTPFTNTLIASAPSNHPFTVEIRP